MQLKSLPADEDFSFKHKWDLGVMVVKNQVEINRVFRKLQRKEKLSATGRWKSIEELKMIYELSKDCLFPPPENFDR